MTCLFIIHSPRDPLSAVFSYVERRAAYVERLGIPTEIWSPQDFPRLRRVRPALLPVLYAVAVAWRLQRHRPRPTLVIFHSHSGWLASWVRRFWKRTTPRAVIQFHGLEPLYYRAVAREAELAGAPLPRKHRAMQTTLMPLLLKIACRNADAVWCLNTTERSFLVEHRWARRSSVRILPSDVPAELLEIPPERPPGPPRMLFLGQWLPAKGIRYLVEGFARLADRWPSLELICAGTRATPSAVLAWIPAHLHGRVRVRPTVERSELRDLLRTATLFVHPSLSEGSSLALLEALAAGLPGAITSVGAAPDILTDGKDALLIPPGDSASLAIAVDRLLGEPELRARLAAGARETARWLTWEHLCDGYRQALAEALGCDLPPEAGSGPGGGEDRDDRDG